MTTIHTVNRHVSDGEKLLWQRAKEYDPEFPEKPIPFGKIGTHQTNLSKQKQLHDILKRWEREGLVDLRSKSTGNFTQFGEQVDRIEEDQISGESWR